MNEQRWDDATLPSSSMATPSRRSVFVADVGGASRRGARRQRNEDAWGFRTGEAFVVADGMGGRAAGDDAANAAVDALLDALTAPVHDWRTVVERAHVAVVAATGEGRGQAGGAVFAAARCDGHRTSVLHVGDARAYRLRGGLAEPLTRDHSIAEAIADVGVRRSDSGLEPRQLAAVTSFLGDDQAWQEFTVRELTVRVDDRIVLCSDGVHRHLTAASWAMAAEIEMAGDAADFLVETACAGGSTDDATALVIDLDVPPTDWPNS